MRFVSNRPLDNPAVEMPCSLGPQSSPAKLIKSQTESISDLRLPNLLLPSGPLLVNGVPPPSHPWAVFLSPAYPVPQPPSASRILLITSPINTQVRSSLHHYLLMNYFPKHSETPSSLQLSSSLSDLNQESVNDGPAGQIRAAAWFCTIHR